MREMRRSSASVVAIAAVVAIGARADAQETRGRAPAKIGFEEAVQRAMARSPNAELAAEDVRRSEALVQQARSSWLPTLSANGTYTRLDADRKLNGNVTQGVNSVTATSCSRCRSSRQRAGWRRPTRRTTARSRRPR